MEATTSSVEPVTLTEVLQLSTWDRERTNEELDSFITRRELSVRRKLF